MTRVHELEHDLPYEATDEAPPLTPSEQLRIRVLEDVRLYPGSSAREISIRLDERIDLVRAVLDLLIWDGRVSLSHRQGHTRVHSLRLAPPRRSRGVR